MSGPYLECVGCGRDYPISTVNSRCVGDEPLEVRYNLDSVPRNRFQTQRSGFFVGRYAPFFPYLDPDPLFSLGEGQTSLLRSVFWVEKLGLKELLFKNETQNPTWTFKDRWTACSFQNASSLELLEQTGGQLPDFLTVPLGSGGLCRGILKEFDDSPVSVKLDQLPQALEKALI